GPTAGLDSPDSRVRAAASTHQRHVTPSGVFPDWRSIYFTSLRQRPGRQRRVREQQRFSTRGHFVDGCERRTADLVRRMPQVLRPGPPAVSVTVYLLDSMLRKTDGTRELEAVVVLGCLEGRGTNRRPFPSPS